MMAGTFLGGVFLFSAVLVMITSRAGYNKQPESHAATASPSGQAMPVGDLDGWRQNFTDDFTTDAPLGTFQTKYASKWHFYLDGWKDTAGQQGAPSRYYPSKVLSASGGVLNKYLHTENGTPMAAALLPILNGQANGSQLYGKYTIRFKSDSLLGFKTAWLQWPDSGVWPRDGEIDYPEGDLSKSFGAFIHRQGATTGTDQTAFSNLGTYTSWHTASLEWLPGKINLILDGVTVGTSTNRIPNTSMHWVIQTESCLPTCPAATVAGNLQIDWAVVYAYSPGTKATVPAPNPSPIATPPPTPVPTTSSQTTTTYGPTTKLPSASSPTPTPSGTPGVGGSPTPVPTYVPLSYVVTESRKDVEVKKDSNGIVRIIAPVTGTQVKSVEVREAGKVVARGVKEATLNTYSMSEGTHSLEVSVTDMSNVELLYYVKVRVDNFHGFWPHLWYTLTVPWRSIFD